MHAAREHRVQAVLHAFDDNPSGFEQPSSARTRPPMANQQIGGSPLKQTQKRSTHARTVIRTEPAEGNSIALSSVAGVEGWDGLGRADRHSPRASADGDWVESPSGDTRSGNASPEESVVILPGDSVSQQNRPAGVEVCPPRLLLPFKSCLVVRHDCSIFSIAADARHRGNLPW